jgi:hypothetical protein
MKPNMDYGRLTQEETAEIAVEALAELTLNQRVQAVLKAFDQEERDELASWLDADNPGGDPETTTEAPVEGTPSASGTDSTG